MTGVERTRLCQALLTPLWGARATELFSLAGPAQRALDLYENMALLSTGEQLMLETAFAFWNGSGGPSVGALLVTLDGANLIAIAEAFRAAAQGPVRR